MTHTKHLLFMQFVSFTSLILFVLNKDLFRVNITAGKRNREINTNSAVDWGLSFSQFVFFPVII